MQKPYPKQAITGLVLAGGRARRMGGDDKGLLVLAGKPLVVHAVDLLKPQVGSLIINANRNIERYQAFAEQIVRDDVGEFFGPLAGMLAALEISTSDYVLSVPCDSPLLVKDYGQRMYTALVYENADLSVASDGERLQPVFALLRCELAADLRDYLAAGERKIDRWFARQRMAVADFSDQAGMFRNINTPQELQALEAELA